MTKTFEEDMTLHLSERNASILGFDKMNPLEFSKNYFEANLADLSVDPNANVGGISPNNYLSELAKPFARDFFFRKLFEFAQKRNPNFSLKNVYNGSIYVHNSTKLQPYCFGTSADEIALFGRPYGKLKAIPPKRLESFMGQYTEFLMDNSQQFAGAIASTNLVPWMAWFVEKGKGECPFVEGTDCVGNVLYTDKDIENCFQSMVHVLNNNFRVGGDSPFTNISVNSEAVYNDIFGHFVFPDGKTVKDLMPTIMRIQKIIVEFMSKGQTNGLPYPFPILTANFKVKEPETDWFRYIAEKNANGCMNVNYSPKFSMCCRLSLDFDYKQNSFGGGGVKVGSMFVGNINLPRIAYLSRQKSTGKYDAAKTKYLTLLKDMIHQDIELIHAYKDIFQWLIDSGYLIFFKEPCKWYDISMFFGTVGFCGIYDAAEIMYPGNDKTAFSNRIDFMKDVVDVLVAETKHSSNGIKFNVEEVPSEAAAGKMALFNKEFGETREYYSNQFIPLSLDVPLWERINIEAKLQSMLTGGGMTFLNFESKLSPKQSYELHKKILDMGFNGQFCINYGYSSCGEHTMHGKVKECPICKKPMNYWTRVVGYLAKQTSAAKSKSKEISDRKFYSLIE